MFTDINVSGATPPHERPGMGALLRAITRGELGGVAAYSLDRLSREPAHGDALVREITGAGGVIITPTFPTPARTLGEARMRETDTAGRLDLLRHWTDAHGLDALARPGDDTVAFMDTDTKRSLVASVFPAITMAKDRTINYDPDTSTLPRRGHWPRPGNDKAPAT